MHIDSELFEVNAVEPKEGHILLVAFSDGQQKTIDLSSLLQSPPPVFIPLQDATEFQKVSVNPVGGIQWECGADLSADYLLSAPCLE